MKDLDVERVIKWGVVIGLGTMVAGLFLALVFIAIRGDNVTSPAMHAIGAVPDRCMTATGKGLVLEFCIAGRRLSVCEGAECLVVDLDPVPAERP